MKRVLVDYLGGICHIVVPGGDERPQAIYCSREFEVVEGAGATSRWVDAPDEVDEFWRLENGEWVDRSISYTDPARARVVAYGQLGEQLDMIYKDMVNGTTNWQEHIASVKSAIPMDPELINQGKREPVMHDRERPSWSYLQGFNDTNDVVA